LPPAPLRFPVLKTACSGVARLQRHAVSFCVCALLGGTTACGQPPLKPEPATPGAPNFTVMSYNIEFHSAGEPKTLDAIGAQQMDIVAMQEVTFDMQALIQARYADLYPYQLYYAATGTAGLGVLSRYPLTDDGLRPGPHGWHPAWHVRVDVPGVPVELLDVHLRSLLTGEHGALRSILDTPSDHLAEIQGFTTDFESGISNLVLGDFNEDSDGEAVNYLEQNGFVNILPQFHPGQPTWRYPSVGDQLELSVDHILYDDTLRPLDAWVEVEGRSDHLPVLAHFEARAW